MFVNISNWWATDRLPIRIETTYFEASGWVIFDDISGRTVELDGLKNDQVVTLIKRGRKGEAVDTILRGRISHLGWVVKEGPGLPGIVTLDLKRSITGLGATQSLSLFDPKSRDLHVIVPDDMYLSIDLREI